MDFLAHLSGGFSTALSPWNVIYAFLGAMIGTAVGVLPGLGPSATIALLLPVTYGMNSTSAVIMLAGIFSGAMYGGSTTSILMNIPGEPSSVTTCLDGYQMARQGRAGRALGMSAMGSFIGATISILLLSMVAPALADFALEFGPAEYTSLVLVGLTMAVYLGGDSPLKGILMTALGLVLAMVGLDPVSGVPRFTFGVIQLRDGIDFVAASMGLFGVGEVLTNFAIPEVRDVYKSSLAGVLPTLEDWKRSWGAVLRGSFVGFFIGLLPGGGAIIGSFVAYAVEKRFSKHPEEFGRGAIEGVAAPETANNAAAQASFIPLLTLGIPGNATIAMIFVALMIHGIQPGPMLMMSHPDLFWGVIASMYIGNFMLLALNLPMIGFWVRLLKVPYYGMAVVIVIICVIGAYSIKNSGFDVGMMIAFGFLGFFLRKGDFPAAPLVLALILGRILEMSLQQALKASGADIRIFLDRPISAGLLIVGALIMLGPVFKWGWKRFFLSQKT
jgi:putative tricarboxylic transport membrane protein